MPWSVLILPQLIDGPWSNRPRVAILEITGQIGVQVRAQEMVRTIKALREDRRVLAVLVDVDSPGGVGRYSTRATTSSPSSSPSTTP